jgi:hypothetical protein
VIPKRVSLRVFLASCVAIAVGLGLFRVLVLGPVISRADAERALLEAGAQITKESTDYFLTDPRWPGKRKAPEAPVQSRWERVLSILTGRQIDLRRISEISFVTAHRFPTDDDLAGMMCFAEVEKLDLTMIERTELPSGFTNRNLGSQAITNRGMVSIAKLPALRELVLGDANLSDDALEALSGSASLELIALQKSQITDAGLARLATIPTLKEIYVANNEKLTLEGVRDFRQRRPEVHVWSNYASELGRGPKRRAR